uniref:Uncharacterized protein n=1 Tax=Arundo donax TaxID=35708 RepID=A0A0A9F3Z7_ARUDO
MSEKMFVMSMLLTD